MRPLLLSSGGLDSALLAGMHPSSVHLWINYGQLNAQQERRAATNVAAHYRADLHHANVILRALAHSSVTSKQGALIGEQTVVPNRNAILISMGVAVALEQGCTHVLIGCNRNDHDVYFDCRPGFIAAMDEVAMRATGNQIRVGAPLLLMTKAEIGARAHTIGVPIEETWSCYRPEPAGIEVKPCGWCNACQGREEALAYVHRCS